MAGVNKAVLIGYVGKDPEVRTLDNGTKVARFSIATSESYKHKTTGETVESTEWHNIVCWRGLADVVERFLKKGNQVYLEGKISTRSYDDSDGVTRCSTEITARELTLLGSKSDNQNSTAPVAQSEPVGDGVSDDGDDLPF